MLVVIWATALAMALGALVWMISLILLRFFHEAREVRWLNDRTRVQQALVDYLHGGRPLAVSLASYAQRARLMAEVLLDFLAIVRGGDLERVIAELRALSVDKVIRRRISRGSLPGRLACVEALGAFPGPETQAALRVAAARGAPLLRLAALRSLVQAEGEVTVERLLADLASGKLVASGQLSELMQMVVELDTAAAVAASARRDLSDSCRMMLLEAMGRSGDYGLIGPIEAHLRWPNPEVREAAVRALGKLMHPASEACLAEALRDGEWQVRSAAAEVIGDGRMAGQLMGLAAALRDPVWRVRFQSAAALAKFGAPGAVHLKAAADGTVEVARRAAALTLAEHGLVG